jgi:hypothetical protein
MGGNGGGSSSGCSSNGDVQAASHVWRIGSGGCVKAHGGFLDWVGGSGLVEAHVGGVDGSGRAEAHAGCVGDGSHVEARAGCAGKVGSGERVVAHVGVRR